MVRKYKSYYKSKIGLIEITGTEDRILSVCFVRGAKRNKNSDVRILKECIKQIDEYFKGKRRKFSLNLQLQGTHFQKRVWSRLTKIPFGKTTSYKDIAGAVGNKNAARAVGNANKNNKLAIIIPCHRVIGNNGALIGYRRGLWRKKWLLRHEKILLSRIRTEAKE